MMQTLMQAAVAEGRDALDAMHDALAIRHERHLESESTEPTEITDPQPPSKAKVRWTSTRLQPGFIVPIATGYQALSPITPSNNARDRDTPHRLAESVLTLGEFVLPIRLDRPSKSLWRYHVEGDLYTCRQDACEISNELPSPVPGEL
jgi:CRISPR-associated protein Csy2